MLDLKQLIDAESLKKRYARVNMYDARTELGYQAKRNSVSIALRKVADLGAQLVENLADVVGLFITETMGSFFGFFLGQEIARNLGAFAGSVTSGIAGIATLGVAGAISAGFTQMDFFHQKSNLRDLYAEEIGAKLNKPASDVTVSDMEALADENPILKQELKRARRQRNFAVPLAIGATLASFTAVHLLLPALVGAAAIAGFEGFLMKVTMSMLTYGVVKIPLQLVGNSVFDLCNETVNDRIVDIKRTHEKGVDITPHDLLPVFIKANEKLDNLIKAKFGQPYDKLPPERQIVAVQEAGAMVPLERLACDINSGEVNATELLFASVGQSSGVPRKELVEMVTEDAGVDSPPQVQLFQEKLSLTRRDPKRPFAERVTLESAAEGAVTF